MVINGDVTKLLVLGDRSLGELLATAFPKVAVYLVSSSDALPEVMRHCSPDAIVIEEGLPWAGDLDRWVDPEQERTPLRLGVRAGSDNSPIAGVAELLERLQRTLPIHPVRDEPTLFDGIPTGLYRSTPDGKILDANPALVQMLGFPGLASLLSMNAADLHMHQEDRDRVWQELVLHGQVLSTGIQLRRADGTPIWVEEFAHAVRDASGHILYNEGALIDITQRRKAEAELRETEERLRTVTDLSFDGFGISEDGVIIDASRRLAEILGCEPSELIGRPVSELVAPEWHDEVRRRMEPGEAAVYEHLALRKDGSRIWVEARGHEAIFHGRKVRITFIRDIHQRKCSEEDLRRREAILEAVTFAGEQFLQRIPWSSCMDVVLERIGRAANASRAYLFAFHQDGDGTPVASQRFEWVASGVGQQIDNPGLQNLPRLEGGFAHWAVMLERREVVVGKLADFSPQEQEMLAGQDIQTLLLAPIFVEDSCWGFIGLDECRTERTWSEGEIHALRAAASSLGAAVLRQRVDDALRRLQAFNENLVLNMGEGIVVSDAEGRVVFANPAALDILGCTDEEILTKHWREYTPQDQQPIVERANERRKRGDSDTYELEVIRADGSRRVVLVTGTPRIEGGHFTGTLAVLTDITKRKHTDEALSQRARELASLYQTSLEIGAQPGLDDVLWTIVRRAAELLDVPMGSLYLVRPDERSLELVVSIKLQEHIGKVLAFGEGAAGRVAERGELLEVEDYQSWEGRIEALTSAGMRRVLAVPMRRGRRVLGVINLSDTRSGLPFTQEQMRLASLFADQAAIAVENARLLENERKRSLELARSKGLLTALGQVAAQVERTYDPSLVLDVLAREIRAVGLNYWLAFTDKDSEGMWLRTSSLASSKTDQIRQLLGLGNEGLYLGREHVPLFEEVVLERRPVIQSVDEALKMVLPRLPRVIWVQLLRLCGARPEGSVVNLPLVVGEQSVGMLALWGEGIGEADVAACALFVSQLSSSMEKASLLDETRRRATFLEAVTRIAAALRAASTASEMLDIVLEQLEGILEVQGACVARLDPASGEILFEEGRRRWRNLRGLRIEPGSGVAGHVIQTGESFVRDDLARNGVRLESELLRKVKAIACVPLSVQQRPIGCVMIGRDSSIAPEDLRVLAATADMVGNAIDRAQVVETLEQRVVERTHELEQANARLQELDALKSEFVTNVSHELRTPITNILLYLDLIDQPLDSGKRTAYASVLKREAERLGRLIEDLLTLSRIERGLLPIRLEPHALDPLIAEVIAAHEARAEEKRLKLEHVLNPDLPVVLVGREPMLQVFTNLIGNAVAYAPRGGRVRVRSEISEHNHRPHIAVHVHNDGPPIPEEDLPHIFERFYRGKQAQRSGEPGTGLGLAISKDIVEGHEGNLQVSSGRGRGTTFSVQLPFDRRRPRQAAVRHRT
jgi:PAS domain S-box-containing protein